MQAANTDAAVFMKHVMARSEHVGINGGTDSGLIGSHARGQPLVAGKSQVGDGNRLMTRRVAPGVTRAMPRQTQSTLAVQSACATAIPRAVVDSRCTISPSVQPATARSTGPVVQGLDCRTVRGPGRS